MKEKLIYCIEEERNYGGDVIAYIIADGYKVLARVSKEEGDNALCAIKKNGKFYNYEVRTTNTGSLCWTFYFEIDNKLPEPEEKIDERKIYGHCPYCGSINFIAVPRVPGSVFFNYGEHEPDMMCKNCRNIVDGNDLIYGRYNK